ncbi:hypothetical protein BJX63DRAFT_437280 [Aspergillus granulosus]|uniref:Uncharacterized protein n=1 Tax=Aspergillus granulosus TaxID=176169 RepID=A0ABR4GX95_9EURO
MIYSYINPFQHYIKIRCDDPKKQCQNRPDNDPCQPSKPNPGDPPQPKPTLIAYATNSDPDDSGTPMINFCGAFFDRRSLADAITYGKGLHSPHNLRLSNYDNRAQTFLHELYHLNLAADSPANNPSVQDLKMDIKLSSSRTKPAWAYGPFGTKVLARWQGIPGVGSVGYYVQRNADNLAYYALAKYVMSKNGNIYPHIPVVAYEIDGPPYPGSLAKFVKDGSGFYLNTSDDDLSAWDAFPGEGYPGCSDDLNDREVTPALTIDGFVPASAYPDDYNDQVSTWIEALGLTDGGSDPGLEGDAGQQIAIASCIDPLGDPASWERLFAYDTGKVNVLVANVLSGLDYVEDWCGNY